MLWARIRADNVSLLRSYKTFRESVNYKHFVPLGLVKHFSAPALLGLVGHLP
jgi:hypothetical protein